MRNSPANVQVLVVQKMDSAIHRIIHYPLDWETDCAIQWMEIYPVDNIIHLLNNGYTTGQ